MAVTEEEARGAPMASAPFVYRADGAVDWGRMWVDFCALAQEGGPAHRPTMLYAPERPNTADEAYRAVVAEIVRGIMETTGLEAWAAEPGWIAVSCPTAREARWLAEAILRENVQARADGTRLLVPVGARFVLEEEIKNVITVVAKTAHYLGAHEGVAIAGHPRGAPGTVLGHQHAPLSAPRHAAQRPAPGTLLRVGVGGPVGAGKTALIYRLCRALAPALRLGVVTNDIYTREDAAFLARHSGLPEERVLGVETGGCPHSAIRDDVSGNLEAIDDLLRRAPDLGLVLVESGGDNLAATFSPDLVERDIYVIDVAAGDKIPRKRGRGMTSADLLVINKIDLAPYVGADLAVMARDAAAVRGDRPTVFTNLQDGTGLSQVLEVLLGWLPATEHGDATVAPIMQEGRLPRWSTMRT